MERGEFINQCEETISQFDRQMQHATMQEDDDILSRLVEEWRLAQEDWLLAAQGMSSTKARAVMVGFTLNELTNWMNERRPGPPPSVLTLYPNGPVSDEEFKPGR